MPDDATLFRQVALPEEVPGRLYLHSMPGRYEPFSSTLDDLERTAIQTIVCLTQLAEVFKKSPDYAGAIRHKTLPCAHRIFGVPDFGVPRNPGAFRELAQETADGLGLGHNVLIHCAAGIGRTGTLALCVLLLLGLPWGEAYSRVNQAGSNPESQDQERLAQWVAGLTR